MVIVESEKISENQENYCNREHVQKLYQQVKRRDETFVLVESVQLASEGTRIEPKFIWHSLVHITGYDANCR